MTSGIMGWVWFDRNGDGGMDPGEPGRVGALVVAHDVDTGIDHTTRTDANGGFELSGLPLGTYDVSASPEGYNSVRWPVQQRTLTDSRPGSESFPQQGGRIFGKAWHDVDGDGRRADDEPAVSTTFTVSGQSLHEGPLSRTLVGSSYSFEDLPAGVYSVRAAPPGGAVPTLHQAAEWYRDSDITGENASTPLIDLFASEVVYNVDAGFVGG